MKEKNIILFYFAAKKPVRLSHLAIHGVERGLQNDSADGGCAACQQVKIRHHVTGDAGAQWVSPYDDLKKEQKLFIWYINF